MALHPAPDLPFIFAITGSEVERLEIFDLSWRAGAPLRAAYSVGDK
jgi:hypothetical protein